MPGRTFKFQSVRKGIGIGECAPGLTGQKILVLSVKLAEAYRVPVVVAEEVKLEIDLHLVSAVIQSSLPGLPGESGGAHRDRRILRVRRGRRRKAGGNICAIVRSRVIQVIEEIGFHKTAEFHVSAGAWEGERTHAISDPAAHCRYGARLPRFVLPCFWSGFRCHSIPLAYVQRALLAPVRQPPRLPAAAAAFCACCIAAI